MSQSPVLAKDRAPRQSNDSSSSRESSSERVKSRKQRSFSPDSNTSEAAPQITVRGSSPSADHPVIRQGLAFRTSNIHTYEPSVKSGDATFLPGQEVPSTAAGASSSGQNLTALGPPSASPTPGPPASASNPATPSPHLSAMSTPSDKSAPQKGPKKVAKAVTKKTNKADDASFTTGRFRLSQYSAPPNDGPPLLHAQGPYASVYRTPVSGAEGTPPPPRLETSSSPVASTAPAPSSAPRLVMADPSAQNRRSSKPQPTQPTISPAQDEPSGNSPTQVRPRPVYPRVPSLTQPQQSSAVASPPNPIPRGSIAQPTPTAIPSMVSPGATNTSPNHPSSTAYYRRNYEQDQQAATARPGQLHPGQPSSQINDPRNVDATMAPPPGDPAGPQGKGKERELPGQRQSHPLEPVRPPRGNFRLVTALIQDNRSDPPDHQLAEVHIRCWSGGRPDELWCDAKDLSEALQASASRIDGPAKVFTQRGAYRQCFLRITADQEDRYNSMNLALASDRTIPVSVESWLPPGVQGKPAVDWRMPWHGSPTLSHPHPHGQSSAQYQSYQHPQHLQTQQQTPHHLSPTAPSHIHYGQQRQDDGRHGLESRKRPSYNEHGSPDFVPESPMRRTPFSAQSSPHAVHDPRYEAPTVSRNTSASYPRKRHFVDASSPTDDHRQGDVVMDTRPDIKGASYDGPQSEQVVFEMIDELMKIDVTVSNFHRLMQSSKLIHTVHAFRLVEEICSKYVNRLLPAKAGVASHQISEVDIARGLGAEDPRRFILECRETLWLLDFYGDRGKRGENPKVVEMLKEDYRPDFPSIKPIKQLQKLLKDIDAQWMREHPESRGGESSRPTPRT